MLQDLSNRVLAPQINSAEQRLPLADERLHISEARRVLEQKQPGKAEAAGKAIEAVLTAFKGGGSSQ
jgi:hypothetical protein